jgi:adhesin transport system membrane fusion protein
VVADESSVLRAGPQDIHADLAKAQEELSGIQQVMAQRREERVLTDVRAPMDGVVRNVRLTTIGGVVRRNLPATVKLISADTISEQIAGQEMSLYRVHVKIERHDLRTRAGERLEIQPGMTGTVEIKTGERTIWEFLTKPITRTLHESLREK